jgi:hypothetical protein
MDLFFYVGIEVGFAMGFGLVCLVLAFLDAVRRPKQTEPNSALLPEFRPGGRDGCHTRSSHS